MHHIQFSNAGVEALRLTSCHSYRLGHNYVGTEHLLLGVIESAGRDEVLRSMIEHFDLSLEKADAALSTYVDRGIFTGPTHRPETPRLRMIYREAEAQAVRHGSDFVRPRHLLLALLPASAEDHASDASLAGVVLSTLGVNFDVAMDDATHVLVREERQSYSLAMSED